MLFVQVYLDIVHACLCSVYVFEYDYVVFYFNRCRKVNKVVYIS